MRTSTIDNMSYFEPAPVLLSATSQRAMARAQRTIEALGLRVGAAVPVEQARDRIERQVSATAVWIELDCDCGSAVDDLMTHVSRDVASGRYAAVVSTIPALLDQVAARLDASDVELIIDATDSDRAAAFAIATARIRQPLRLSDISSDRNAERLRQLSDEVSRIASTLARLSTAPATSPPALKPLSAGDVPPVSVETVRAVIRARRLRDHYFSSELFADPAWDMMLDLLQAEIAQLRVPVSSLCIAAAVPPTTALRWLKSMVNQGILIRRADPQDGRRVFVELAPAASQALRRYFGEIGPLPVT